MISKGDKQHYCLIKDLNRFLNRCEKRVHAGYFCRWCLHRFTREDLLERHQPSCRDIGPQKVSFPEEGKKWLFFEKYEMKIRVPYAIYADFECTIRKISGAEPDRTKSFTCASSKHEPCGFALIKVGIDGIIVGEPFVYQGRKFRFRIFRKSL